MITWMIEHWTLLVGGGGIVSGIVTAFRYLPRALAWIAVTADCHWHRVQGLRREKALEREIDLMTEALERANARNGTGASSVSTTPPTTPTTTR